MTVPSSCGSFFFLPPFTWFLNIRHDLLRQVLHPQVRIFPSTSRLTLCYTVLARMEESISCIIGYKILVVKKKRTIYYIESVYAIQLLIQVHGIEQPSLT